MTANEARAISNGARKNNKAYNQFLDIYFGSIKNKIMAKIETRAEVGFNFAVISKSDFDTEAQVFDLFSELIYKDIKEWLDSLGYKVEIKSNKIRFVKIKFIEIRW